MQQEVQVPKKCACIRAKRPKFWVSPNRARARKTCAKPPPWLAHSVRNVSELVPARHMSYDLCICAHQLRHNAIDLCQPRGALCTSNRARTILGNPKLCDRFAQMNLVGRCSCSLLFVPHTSIRGNKEFSGQKPPCEKTNFRS